MTTFKNIHHHIWQQQLSPKTQAKLSQSIKTSRNENLYRSFEKARFKGGQSIYWGYFLYKEFKFKDHPYIKAHDLVLFTDFDMMKKQNGLYQRGFGQFISYINQHKFRLTGQGYEPKHLAKPFELYKVEKINSKLKLVKVTDEDELIFPFLRTSSSAHTQIAKRLEQLSWARIHKQNREKVIEEKMERQIILDKKQMVKAKNNMNAIYKKETTAAQTIQREARKMLQQRKQTLQKLANFESRRNALFNSRNSGPMLMSNMPDYRKSTSTLEERMRQNARFINEYNKAMKEKAK